MPKCKLCGTRLAEGAAKCPVCGASVSENGEATSASVMENINLPTYKCPSCKADIVGEHRFCPSCGINLQDAANEAQKAAETQAKETAQNAKFCPECGAALEQSAKFCGGCGARLGGTVGAHKTVQQATPSNTGSYQTRSAQESIRQDIRTQPVQNSSVQENPQEKKAKETVEPNYPAFWGYTIVISLCILVWIIKSLGSGDFFAIFTGIFLGACYIGGQRLVFLVIPKTERKVGILIDSLFCILPILAAIL